MASALSNLFAVLSLDSQSFLDDLHKTKKKTDSFMASFANVGGAVAMGALSVAGAGVAALGGFLASSIAPASDLSETISKTKIVFGDSADAILAWGDTAAATMGMSENSALAAAGTYGNLFRAMGMGEDVSAKMSTGLVGLAGDLASFNNMDPTEVLDKLRAGLSGETEPLKSLGVNINEALLKERAFEMGLWDGVGTLDAAAKAQASYALIMEQTSLAQGDFARTSDGLANQQRILKAKFEDIRATVGGALLPVITKFATTLSEYLARPEVINFIQAFTDGLATLAQNVLTNLPAVIAWFQNVFTFLQNNEGIVVGIFAALGVAVTAWAVVTAAAAWTAMAPFLPVIAVLVAIAAVVYLLYQAWTTNFGGIQEKLQAVWAVVQPVLQMLWDWLSTNIPIALQALSDFWQNVLLPAIMKVWEWMQSVLFPFLSSLADFIGAVLGKAIEALAGIWQNVLQPALEKIWAFIRDNLFPLLERFGGWLSEKFGPIFDGISSAIEKATGWLGEMAEKIKNIQLPAWMTPGSPTPWELGLLGVGDAMRQLARTEMPAFTSALELQASPMGVGSSLNADGGMQGAGGGVGGGMVININVTSDGVTDERDVARKIGSAVEVILRERGLA